MAWQAFLLSFLGFKFYSSLCGPLLHTTFNENLELGIYFYFIAQGHVWCLPAHG
jgi:hypothetical protein